MNREEAKRLVVEEVNRDYRTDSDSLVVIDESTQDKPYGWVFFYCSQTYLKTRDIEYALGGNGPVVVERDSGRIVQLGSARPAAEEIARYEAKRGAALAPQTLEEAAARVVKWRKTDDVDFPWEATVDGHRWRLRLGEFPAEDLFIFIVDGREVGALNDVPENWHLAET